MCCFSASCASNSINLPPSKFMCPVLNAQVEQIPGMVLSDYREDVLWANSSGGVAVPVTVAYNAKLFKADGSNACVLQA